MARTRFLPIALIALAVFGTLLILSGPSRQVVSQTAQKITPPAILDKLPDQLPDLPDLPELHIPSLDIPSRFHWYSSAHRPPVQQNSTNGETSWYTDWRWLNPFSSSVTLDEDRALLPPLIDQPYVYTYYDTNVKRTKEVRKSDENLLLAWRRAWWAQGFRAVVLTPADALANPMQAVLRLKGMPKALEADFLRWLAWARMGTGIFTDYHCFPMAAHDDNSLQMLRRGRYSQLMNFGGLSDGFFAAEKQHLELALKTLLDDTRLSTYKSVIDGIPKQLVRSETTNAIACYDLAVLAKRYAPIYKAIDSDLVKGGQRLLDLITSHLHITFQNTFAKGIAVLKPLPAHSTALTEPSLHLAQLLVECPETTLPASCPPNNARCKPCVSSRMPIYSTPSFRNESQLFTIATVPHPYTLLTLNNLTSEITTSYIRRHTDRDMWLTSVTQELLGTGRGAPSRLVTFKDMVASAYSQPRSLWFTVEHFPADFHTQVAASRVPSNEVQQRPPAETPFSEDWLQLMDWRFGFRIPRSTVDHGQSMNPVPLPERWQRNSNEPIERKTSYDPPKATAEDINKEIYLLTKARLAINSRSKEIKKTRDVAEKWNLADFEAWNFVRAFQGRGAVLRDRYENGEGRIPGGARKNRWW